MKKWIAIVLLLASCDSPISEADRKKWTQPGACKVANQIKAHGVMNDVEVDWTCPLCKEDIHGLRWDICRRCCERLGICVVCRKKY